MKRSGMIRIATTLCSVLLFCSLTACAQRDAIAPEQPFASPAVTEPVLTPEPTPTPAPAPEPGFAAAAETTPVPTLTPQPAPLRDQWMISFAGDCTIGTLHAWQGSPAPLNMLRVIDGDWTYPFSNVSELFAEDDFTMVNLEGTFTELNVPKGKAFCFKAPPEAAQALVCGGIDAVTLANNHSRDYGEQSVEDTRTSLESLGILWADEGAPLICDLPDGGPRLGVLAYNCVESLLPPGSVEEYMRICGGMYESCVDAGCDLVIAYLHWGWEYRSEPEQWMIDFAHRLAERGCDMVIGSHPHILQRFEYWEETPICYSLGNFCFGGHSGPEDMDSVILRQRIVRTEDGYALADTMFLPCCISSVPERNDYRPALYSQNSPGYGRVLAKLGLASCNAAE